MQVQMALVLWYYEEIANFEVFEQILTKHFTLTCKLWRVDDVIAIPIFNSLFCTENVWPKSHFSALRIVTHFVPS